MVKESTNQYTGRSDVPLLERFQFFESKKAETITQTKADIIETEDILFPILQSDLSDAVFSLKYIKNKLVHGIEDILD